ncbi:MAG: hypothetical protein E6Q53_01745 [Candidatus Moraniibacteriota bacterium]|nr:MAG: hypothetical protein E6Q53_01745 [Candidatus Moranbacteria bacterium]
MNGSAVFSQDVVISGSSGKNSRDPVLVKRQGTSPILTVQLKASEADTEARELHREILRVLSDGYEERFFPLKKDGDNRINQTIWCTVVVASDLVASSIEVRCGRRFPRQIFVGLTDAGIGTSEFSAVAKRLPAMIDELYNLATKLPDN